MLRALWDLVCGLVRRDRIRISPNDGRLLRLEPPCSLTVGRRPVQVVRRRVSESSAGPRVEYDCETESGTASLIIHLTRTLQTDAVWVEGGRSVPVAESDVVTF